MYSSGLLAYLTPVVSFAALDGIKGLLREARAILNLLIPILMALAIVYFFWGIAQFILNDAGSDKTREEGKKKIIWGIIALFVMMSIMGIISLMSGLTGISTTVTN